MAQTLRAAPSGRISSARLERTNRMTTDTFKDIEKLESALWEAADNLRANSKLTSSPGSLGVKGTLGLKREAWGSNLHP